MLAYRQRCEFHFHFLTKTLSLIWVFVQGRVTPSDWLWGPWAFYWSGDDDGCDNFSEEDGYWWWPLWCCCSVQLFLAMMHIWVRNWHSSNRMPVITRKWCENNDCSGVQWPAQWKRARLHAVVVQQPCDNSRLSWCLLDCHLKMWELL